MKEIRNKWFLFKDSYRNFIWATKTHIRFWLLENLYMNEPIEVYDWHDHSARPEGCGYLDIRIKLPSLIPFGRWYQRWIFTVESLNIVIEDQSPSNLYTLIFHHKREWQSNKEFMKCWDERIAGFVRKNKKKIFKKPIVEFDHVYTGEEGFKEKDVVKYTKVWLSKFYPNLAKRKIIFKES